MPIAPRRGFQEILLYWAWTLRLSRRPGSARNVIFKEEKGDGDAGERVRKDMMALKRLIDVMTRRWNARVNVRL